MGNTNPNPGLGVYYIEQLGGQAHYNGSNQVNTRENLCLTLNGSLTPPQSQLYPVQMLRLDRNLVNTLDGRPLVTATWSGR
jgi:hypothetical protein